MSSWKPIAWFAAGGIGGALGATLMLDGNGDDSGTTAAPSLVETVTGLVRETVGGTRAGDEPDLAERLDVYREAQEQTDVTALVRDLERAAMRSWSPSRDLEIDALLGRLAEMAPDYAAEVAVALGLDAPFVAGAWLAWADADPDAAIAGLAAIPDAAARREVALALADIVGNNARGIARITAALPAAEQDAIRVAWLERLAAQDPLTAFREATAIGDPALQRRALDSIAVIWAAQEPYTALSQADLLPQNLVQRFRSRVFTEWARVDPEGYVAWLESTPNPPQEATGGFQYLLMASPDLAARVAEAFPGDLGRSIRVDLMNALARSDPERAKAEAAAMSPGQDRDMAIQAVAGALADADPDAALAWAQSLDPPSPTALRSVTMNMARADPARLFAMLDDPRAGIDTQLLVTMATSVTTTDPAQYPEFADGLLARDDPLSTQALQRLVSGWMQRDPETALDWVLANGTEVEATVFASAAQTLAARDPRGAAAYLDRIPPAQRGPWISEVAGQYGRADPQAAMAWISQFQGQQAYDVALRQLIMGATQTDARAAAQMLVQASGNVQLGAASQVASQLAQQDPREALRWSQTLSDARARTTAEGAAVTVWYSSDPAGARRHVLAMPAGADRDQLTSSLVTATALSGAFDRTLLDGISDPTLRQQSASLGVRMLATRDPAQARALLNSEITDPALRAQLETQIREIEGR